MPLTHYVMDAVGTFNTNEEGSFTFTPIIPIQMTRNLNWTATFTGNSNYRLTSFSKYLTDSTITSSTPNNGPNPSKSNSICFYLSFILLIGLMFV